MRSLSHPALMVLTLASMGVFAGCESSAGSTLPGKQTSIMQMRTDAMAELRTVNPAIEDRIAQASGYAVFSDFGIKFLATGSGNGFGVVHDHKAAHDTYMRMGALRPGPGDGITSSRILFVFNTEKSLRDFVDQGWNVGSSADAGAKLKTQAAQAGGALRIGDMDVYQFTQSGLAPQFTAGLSKYWKDKDLNGGR